MVCVGSIELFAVYFKSGLEVIKKSLNFLENPVLKDFESHEGEISRSIEIK